MAPTAAEAPQSKSDSDSMCSKSDAGSPAAAEEKASGEVEGEMPCPSSSSASASAPGLHRFFTGGKRPLDGGAGGGGGGGGKVPKNHVGGRGNKKAGRASDGDKAWEAELLARVDDFPTTRTVYSDKQKQQG